MDQTRTGIANLKAHLSEYLARARCGERVVVYDRNTPIAVIERFREEQPELVVRKGKGDIRDVVGKELVPLREPVDVLAMLREDRDYR